MLLLIASLLSLGLCIAALALQWTDRTKPGNLSEVHYVEPPR
jgi:hypothetical protein